jgi:hypothetical protein
MVIVVEAEMREIGRQIPTQKGSTWRNFKVKNS